MIERMSSIFVKFAQFTYIIWPLFVVTAFVYSFQSIGRRKWLLKLGRRIYKNLLYTWTILFFIWLITLFADDSVPTLLPEPLNSILFFSGAGALALLEVNKLRFLPLRIQARMDLHAMQAIIDLNRMDPRAFEELVAETFRTLGYQAQRTGQTGDRGIDVEVFTKKGERWIVQCKRYRNPVGVGIVRELYGTLIGEKASRAVLVTSADITPPAELWAKGKPIQLIDGLQFLKLMETARQRAKGSLFERFTNLLESMIRHAQTPPALRSPNQEKGKPHPEVDKAVEQTQPIRVVSQPAPQVVGEFPICPHCGVPMVHHPEHPGRKLFRCRNYPDCRVVLDKVSSH